MVRVREVCQGVKVGDEFERLRIIGPFFAGVIGKKGPRWMCVVECNCGIIKVVGLAGLKSKVIKSCGCRKREHAGTLAQKRKTHGLTSHPLYNMWHGMRGRCQNPQQKAFKDYGARGISICEEWTRFEDFFAWSLANGWEPGLEIDRHPDNDGNYEPGNVRWATRVDNMRNTRMNHFVTAWSDTKTISAWLEDPRCNATGGCMYYRLSRRSRKQWTPEDAISTAPMSSAEKNPLGKNQF